jgi:hypothetical protein
MRDIPMLMLKIPTGLREIVFKGAPGGTSEEWLGVANALNNLQLPHLTKIRFCSLDNHGEETLKTFLRNKMVRFDVRGILDFM